MVISEGTMFRVLGLPPAPAPGETVPDGYQKLILTSSFGCTVRVGATEVVVPRDSAVIVTIPADTATTLIADRPFAARSMQDLEGNGEMALHVPYRTFNTAYHPFSWWQDSYGIDGQEPTNVAARTIIIAGDEPTMIRQIRRSSYSDRRLDPNEVWVLDEFVRPNGSRDSTTDPTGYSFTSDRPFWVVSGHPKAGVLRYPDGLPPIGPYARPATRSRGNLHDAMLPSTMAGTVFVTAPLLYSPTRLRGLDLSGQGIGDDRGDVIRFIALFDSTVIRATTAGGEQVMTRIDAGQRWSATAVESATVWTTSRPVMCAQYGKSYGRITSQAQNPEDDPSVDAGMPLLQSVPDTAHWVDHGVFTSPEETLNFMNVVCRSSDAADIRVDGRPLTSTLRRHDIPGTPFTSFSGLILAGRHVIEVTRTDARFCAWTYGSLDGLQLGRIYGSVVAVDHALPCDDTLFVQAAASADTALFTFRVAGPASGCAAIAYAFVETIDGGQWERRSDTLIITRTTPGERVRGTALFATESGRFERRSFLLDGTSSVDADGSTMMIGPNPASDMLHVSMREGAPLPDRIDVVDMFGRIVHTEHPHGVRRITIDLSDLPSGTYGIIAGSSRGRFIVR
jgi:hypothetical protein